MKNLATLRLTLTCAVICLWAACLLNGRALADECVIKPVMTDAELRTCGGGELPHVAPAAGLSKQPIQHLDKRVPLSDRLRDQEVAVTPAPIASTAAPKTTPTLGGEMNPMTILLLIVGALWLFCKFLEVATSGATKAAKATVYVVAAAAGLTVGILEGAVRGVAARYASCPFCLEVIRSRASVCKHCLRPLA
jgi:hypothetical protein